MSNIRALKLKKNALAGLLKEVISIVCGLILPRYYLITYGSEVNGLISSITQFLGFIVFLEMGIGPVIQSNLYKPLADKDSVQVSKIVISAEKFFRNIGGAFIIYIIALCIFYPRVVSTEFDSIFTISLIVIIAISSLVQYLFGAAYQMLINADQLAYVQLNCQTVTLVFNALVSIVLMHLGYNVEIVKLASSLIFVIRPLYYVYYVKKHYVLNLKMKLEDEPIKQKWNGFLQHMAAVVNQNADVVLLTLVSTLQNVSIYSIYYTVVIGVERVVMTVATGLEAMWGNMIANDEKEELKQSFCHIEWLTHTGVTLLFSVTAIMITSFIDIYTSGVNDANYHVPVFGILLTLAYALECYRVPYFRMVKAYGHYKETQWASLVQPILNIGFSFVLIVCFGINGAAAGTAIAMLYHTMYLARYTSKKLLDLKIRQTVKQFLTDILSILVIWCATRWSAQETSNYVQWVGNALGVMIIAIICVFIINILLYPQEIKKYIYKVLRK